MRSISQIKSFKSTSKRQKKKTVMFMLHFTSSLFGLIVLICIWKWSFFIEASAVWRECEKGKDNAGWLCKGFCYHQASVGLCKSFERNNCWQKLGKESGIHLWVIHEKPHLASKRNQNNRKKSASSFTFDYNDSNLQRQQILSSCLTTKLLNQRHKHQRCKSWKRDKNEHFRREKIMPLSIEMKLL